jgi:hypothetical protein
MLEPSVEAFAKAESSVPEEETDGGPENDPILRLAVRHPQNGIRQRRNRRAGSLAAMSKEPSKRVPNRVSTVAA